MKTKSKCTTYDRAIQEVEGFSSVFTVMLQEYGTSRATGPPLAVAPTALFTITFTVLPWCACNCKTNHFGRCGVSAALLYAYPAPRICKNTVLWNFGKPVQKSGATTQRQLQTRPDQTHRNQAAAYHTPHWF